MANLGKDTLQSIISNPKICSAWLPCDGSHLNSCRDSLSESRCEEKNETGNVFLSFLTSFQLCFRYSNWVESHFDKTTESPLKRVEIEDSLSLNMTNQPEMTSSIIQQFIGHPFITGTWCLTSRSLVQIFIEDSIHTTLILHSTRLAKGFLLWDLARITAELSFKTPHYLLP